MGGEFIMFKPQCSKTRKNWKSTALACWLTVLEISTLLLFTAPPCVEGRSLTLPSEDSNFPADNYEDLCLTPECIHTASGILKSMDPNVDPCEDFYRYACGGYLNRTIIPENEVKINRMLTAEKELREQLRVMLQADINPNEPKYSKLVKKFYRICMNKAKEPATGYEPLLAQLKEIGGWPVIHGDMWNETEFIWTDVIYKLRDAGFNYKSLINLAVLTDVMNDTRRVIYIDQAILELERSDLLRGFGDKKVQDYYELMVDTAVRLGADTHHALEELEELLLFVIQLANIMTPDEERRSGFRFYNPMTLKEMSITYPSIPWKQYFERLLPSSLTLGEDEVVIVSEPDYFSRLEELLAETPKRVLANYLLWRPTSASKLLLDYFPTSDRCCKAATRQFPIIVGALYVKEYFSEEDRANVMQMVTDIRRQFNINLENINWMDEVTRMSALEKAKSMVNHIGYPDELLDDDKLEKIYEKFEFSGDKYFDIILDVSHFNEDRLLGGLHEPMDENKFMAYGDSASVEAYYLVFENGLLFPAGILQNAFFNKDRPNYMNYGAIGYGIGHEITHGFDDIGRQFDKKGNLFNWWASSTEENFRQRTQCIIEQYGNYTVPEVGLHLNGITTQGENIADNGGIKIAYLAYKSWVARNKPEKRLPGINRSPEQMFWLSAANLWCAKYTDEGLRSEINSEPHSPEEFRIIGSFSNMPEFANDYQCPEGSRMNPKKKCSIW